MNVQKIHNCGVSIFLLLYINIYFCSVIKVKFWTSLDNATWGINLNITKVLILCSYSQLRNQNKKVFG